MSSLNRDINAELFNAVKNGEIDKVKSLISKGADVNATNTNYDNSLYLAVENDHLDIAKVLLDNGADFITFDAAQVRHVYDKFLKIQDEYCKSSLHLAARLGDLKAVEDLLKKEANVNAKNDKGQTPLHLTVEVCYVDIPNPDEVDDYWNQYFAAEKKCGYVKIVEALLRNEEINVNAQDNNKKTSLHYAAKNNNKEIVVALIKAGAYINAVDKDGNAPLHLAGAKEIGDLLQSVKEANDKLLEAAKSGNIDDVENLLNGEGKAQVNAIAKGGNTPLHLAAQNGHKDVVEFLLSKGAKVDAQSDDLSTPLHFTAKSRYKDTEKIVKFLLDKGADVNAQNNAGETPLHLILQKIDLDINIDKFYTLLNKKGINVNLTDKNKDTPLHLAAAGGHEDVVKALLDKGANINVENDDGETPLFLAIEGSHEGVIKVLLTTEKIDISNGLLVAVVKGHEGIVKALLTAKEIGVTEYFEALRWADASGHEDVVKVLLTTEKINVAAKDTSGKTLLHWAVEKGYKDIVETLLSRRANVNVVDKDGNTPLHFAASLNKTEVVKILIDYSADVTIKNKDKKTPFNLAETEEIKTLLKNAEKSDDGESSTDSEGDQEEDTGEEEQEGDVPPGKENSEEESQRGEGIIAEEETDLKTEVVGSVASAQTEEQPSSFFGSLFSILTNPFSLIASFFSGIFLWLFSSNGENADEYNSQSDVPFDNNNYDGMNTDSLE